MSPGWQEVAALHSPGDPAGLHSHACSIHWQGAPDLFFQLLQGYVTQAKRLQTAQIPSRTTIKTKKTPKAAKCTSVLSCLQITINSNVRATEDTEALHLEMSVMFKDTSFALETPAPLTSV